MSSEAKKDSKKSAVIRIVIWGVVLVLLLGALISLMVGGNVFGLDMTIIGCGTDMWYDDTDYEVGDYEFGDTDLTDELRELDIHWLSGSVTVRGVEGDTLTIRELDHDGDTPEEADALRWKLQGGKLTIRFCKPRRVVSGSAAQNKTLEVCIPAAWLGGRLGELEVDSVSADVDILLSGQAAALRELDVDTVSGRVKVEGDAQSLSLDTTSGDMTVSGTYGDFSSDTVSGKLILEGSADEMELESTSGNMTVTLYRAARSLEIDTTSGQLTLTLPEDIAGFTAKLSSVSGDIEVEDFPTTGKNKSRVFGDGSMKIDMDSTSGDVTIKQGKPSDKTAG